MRFMLNPYLNMAIGVDVAGAAILLVTALEIGRQGQIGMNFFTMVHMVVKRIGFCQRAPVVIDTGP